MTEFTLVLDIFGEAQPLSISRRFPSGDVALERARGLLRRHEPLLRAVTLLQAQKVVWRGEAAVNA
jgi:hypothetical protein